MKPSFILHIDSLCILEDLSNEQKGELFNAIYCYQIGKEIELSPIIKIAFSQFKNQFIRDEEKYKKTVEARKQAGSKGGKQRVANQANASTTKQNQANQAVSVSKNEKDSVNNTLTKKSEYDDFLSQLKKACKYKSKVTKTKEGAKLFKVILDKAKLFEDYIQHQTEKDNYAVVITKFMEDYETVHSQTIQEKVSNPYGY